MEYCIAGDDGSAGIWNRPFDVEYGVVGNVVAVEVGQRVIAQTVAVDRGGQLRWYGLDGVEHTGGPLVDFDGFGGLDDRLLDTDGDGLADRVLCAGEQRVTGYVDTDGDGRWDVRLTDTDGDGTADGASSL